MMDANVRTGRRGEGYTGNKVLGAYGRDIMLNDNRARLLCVAADKNLSGINTFFSTPKREISHTFQSANPGKGQYRLEDDAPGGLAVGAQCLCAAHPSKRLRSQPRVR